MAIFTLKRSVKWRFFHFYDKADPKAAPHCSTVSAYYKTIRLSPLIFY